MVLEAAEAIARKTPPNPSWHGADLSIAAYLENPYSAYRWVRAEHPVSLTAYGVCRLTRYEDCLRMLRLTGVGMRRTDGTLPGQTRDAAAAEERRLEGAPPGDS